MKHTSFPTHFHRLGGLVILLTVGLSLLAQTQPSVMAGSGENVSRTTGDSEQPALAIAPNDTRLVAWTEDNTQIYTASAQPAGWQTELLVEGTRPRLAAGPDNSIHLVYTADDGTGNLEIYYSRWNNNTWTPPINVSLTSGSSTEPALVVTQAGTPHFVWTDRSLGEPTLYYGTPNGAGPILSARGTAPAIAIDPDQQIHIVWQEPDDDTGLGEIYHIYRSTVDGQPWSFSENISNSPAVDSFAPAITADPDGTVHIAWMEGDQIQVRSGQPHFFAPAITLSGPATDGTVPALAHDSAGQVFAAWTEATTRIQLAIYRPATASWSPPETVVDNLDTLEGFALATDSNDLLYLAWSAYPPGDSQSDIFIRSVTPAPLPDESRVYLPLISRR